MRAADSTIGTCRGSRSHGPHEVRERGRPASTATLVGVYPANIQMAVDAGRPRSLTSWGPWLRLPLQVPMVLSAARIARR